MLWTRLLFAGFAAVSIGSLATLAQDTPAPSTEKKTEAAPAGIDVNKPAVGKFTVVKKTDLKLTDDARKRDVALAVCFPKEEGSYPVILYSVGQGAVANDSLATPEFLASHGYVVFAPTHPQPARGGAAAPNPDQMFEQYDTNKDGKLSKEELPEQLRDFFDTVDTDSDGFISKDELRAAVGGAAPAPAPAPEEPKKEEPKKDDKEKEDEFDRTPDSPEMHLTEDPAQPAPEQPRGRQGRGQRGNRGNDPTSIIDRSKDLLLVIDQMTKLVEATPELKGKTNLEQVAVVGHGAGAAAAVILAGATIDVGEEKGKTFADKRIKAVVPYGPAQSGRYGFSAESWKGLNTPMLAVSGATQMNFGRGTPDPEARKESFKGAPEGNKYFVSIEGASDFDLPGAPAMRMGRGGQAPAKNEAAGNWTNSVTLQFLNSTLKADEAAKTWLAGDALDKGTEGKAKIERK
ncbi:MAG: hypothetical protein IPK87_07260 [Planctomycetes bacterium]|nr:hypothetical protein [Planctomycetota bacterium]